LRKNGESMKSLGSKKIYAAETTRMRSDEDAGGNKRAF